MTTWMIEGNWTGPVNPAGDWTRLAHREYTTSYDRAHDAAGIPSIRFGDGTSLVLRVAEHHGRRDREVNGYGDLITDCIRYGVTAVDDLPDVEVAP